MLDSANISEDFKMKTKALATYEFENFKFLFDMIIFYTMLHAVNIVSKFLQDKYMDINHTSNIIEGLVSLLEEYREIVFVIPIDEAKQMESEMKIKVLLKNV